MDEGPRDTNLITVVSGASLWLARVQSLINDISKMGRSVMKHFRKGKTADEAVVQDANLVPPRINECPAGVRA